MPSFRIVAVVGSAFLLQACAANRPREPGPAESITFAAQTAHDTIVEGAFEGTAVIRDGWITMVVPKATLTFPPGPPERWRSLTIRSFLAVDYRLGAWTAPVESTPVNVWRFLEFPRGPAPEGRTSITLKDTLRYLIPIPPGASLAMSRLAFEVEWVTLYKGYGQTESNFGFSGPLVTTRPPDP